MTEQQLTQTRDSDSHTVKLHSQSQSSPLIIGDYMIDDYH